MKVKICGITRTEDAEFAVNAGADAIGIVNVPESKRFVDLEKAKKIFSHVPTSLLKFVVSTPKNLEDAIKIQKTGATVLQVHNDVTPKLLKKIKEKTKLRVVKQIAVDEKCFEKIKKYENLVDMFLLDTRVQGEFGGTGKTHDWSISSETVKKTKKPVILAGGLNLENVADAIKKVKPYMVDVASGVEKTPGIKDKEKVARFIKNAKSA